MSGCAIQGYDEGGCAIQGRYLVSDIQFGTGDLSVHVV